VFQVFWQTAKENGECCYVQRTFSPRLNCLEDISLGMGDFSLEVEKDFLALSKNDKKVNKKTFLK
jgi:hypothetical protein